MTAIGVVPTRLIRCPGDSVVVGVSCVVEGTLNDGVGADGEVTGVGVVVDGGRSVVVVVKASVEFVVGTVGDVVCVVVVDGSLLLVVVVVVVGSSKKGREVTEGRSVVVLAKLVVLGLVVVVDTDVVLDEGEVVVVSDGASVVDTVRVVVGQCW